MNHKISISKSISSASFFNRFTLAAPLLLRLITGTIMAAHGIAKLREGPTEVWGGFFESLNILAPVTTAWVVTSIEFAGGIFLIAGFLTRITGLLFTGVMVAAIFLVSAQSGLISTAQGPGADLNLALLAGAITLVLTGPGKFSVDYLLGLDSEIVKSDKTEYS